MARKISNLNKGVRVKISPHNSRGIGQILIETGRSFSREVNFAVSEYVYKKIYDSKNGEQKT
jgi:hypothetical protein